ncbi:hypothetical protein [Bartonella sp. cb54]|uniref:hypothetical protein n=1 Tax=Bartonella sp. cb54 TaxID=3385560 RepID=UPI0039A6C38A
MIVISSQLVLKFGMVSFAAMTNGWCTVGGCKKQLGVAFNRLRAHRIFAATNN